MWNPINNGINYQPQLVNAGFRNHQQYYSKIQDDPDDLHRQEPPRLTKEKVVGTWKVPVFLEWKLDPGALVKNQRLKVGWSESYLYYTWNPNGAPCFWSECLGLVLGGWPSKIEVIWVKGVYNIYVMYIFTLHIYISCKLSDRIVRLLEEAVAFSLPIQGTITYPTKREKKNIDSAFFLKGIWCQFPDIMWLTFQVC